jgi:site-specific recombinase XerD
MTEADNDDSYEEYQRQVQVIQLANQPILDGFEEWLYQSTLSEKTINDHVDNIRFFTKYLILDKDPPCRLDEATDWDVYCFLADWFPRKALWCSLTSVKVYLATFKKFFKWMGETGLVPRERVADVLDTLKLDRDELLAKFAE